jgi:hypothetical protein
MDFLDVFSLFVLLVLIVAAVAFILLLGWLPGHLAKSRRSPWAEAINVAGWIGILLPPIWMLALIAAFVRPPHGEGAAIYFTETQSSDLATTIASISQRIQGLETGMRELAPRVRARGAEQP